MPPQQSYDDRCRCNWPQQDPRDRLSTQPRLSSFQNQELEQRPTIMQRHWSQQSDVQAARLGVQQFRCGVTKDSQRQTPHHRTGGLRLDKVLADLVSREPEHPLVAVFQPVIQLNDRTLEDSAAACFNRIKSSHLPTPTTETLLAVFVNWLEQRFFERGKKEIEDMLLGELPDLRETQSGKDLIAIGRSEGKIESLLLLLSARFDSIDPELRQRIESLRSVEMVDRLLVQAVKVDSIDQLVLD